MPLEMKYFVLNPRSKTAGDPWAAAARQAMRFFASGIKRVDRELASSLHEWANRESEHDAALWEQTIKEEISEENRHSESNREKGESDRA